MQSITLKTVDDMEPRMRFSRSFKSSTQSLPSPDGAYIATILPSKLSIRCTRSLDITRVVSLPAELAASVSWFLWSASSARILLASPDNIRVYSSLDSQFSATLTNPTSGTTKATHVAFGADDNEICVFSDFGIKLLIFNLVTSKSVEINSPKFYNPGSAPKGMSYRPGTGNLALLTRCGGKDVISIHSRGALDVTRSWWPETVDAQGIQWSADGRWLVVWESASQGHRLLVYTADGHLFKAWNGPMPMSEEDVDLTLGAGIKLFHWGCNGQHMAVGDYTDRVTILSAPSFSESMIITHTADVKPTGSLQIWQEKITPSPNGFSREFVAATQTVCPPTSASSPPNSIEAKTGTNLLSLDHSGTLLATRTENMPTTIWIWDIGSRILRAVMILHVPIAKASWHPSIPEVLMIRCEGDEARGLVHVWEPSWTQPRIIDFALHIPGGKLIGKTICRWLNTGGASAAMLFSDSQDFILACLPDSDDEEPPWEAGSRGNSVCDQQGESPLLLVPAENERGRVAIDSLIEDEGETFMSGGSEEVEDTFRFRKFVAPGLNG
ncbi:WD40 domain-containing protein [Drepanopeziza brunnea f. sp. 'multigermtubi' MB_m1]|uniref:WD40 domain-containing protein n=1 Tax=Marssonina brunnea f. sp. multigermtubi (strain MB_m1) TaxID=1072389 RepID=K1X5C3_MARBU|nr:WD40 domain-containing protein [Drepanopeziza brunnea f. sp. 'multigermtubi' MB_m1]EKD20302.1 WD40 domain-containing protein [Drepanopeziza brunnea f. sp. 'multigermtubi' MB_m1]